MERAEQLNKSKIPCPETHIEVKRSLCDICTGPYCGLSAYVRDGEVIKVEGLDGYPHSEGKLCTKGASNRSQMYRADRIRTPLRRTGARGSGSFEPITWEEAYQEIGARLNAVKAAYDPHAVVFFSGYAKWYRFWLQRLAHSFGSVNYASENSSCSKSTQMAWRVIAGNRFSADLKNSKLYIGWGCNTLISSYQAGRKLIEAKKRGVKIIIIDPRVTVTSERLADIHLRIRPGTDGILALGMANLIIERGWYDRDLTAIGFCVYVYFVARKKNVPKQERKLTAKERRAILKEAVWALLFPVFVLGSIYAGIATPTEAAVISLFYIIIIELFVYKSVKFKDLFPLLKKSCISAATLGLSIACAKTFVWYLTTQQIPTMMYEWMVSNFSSGAGVMLAICALFLVWGCFANVITLVTILGPVMAGVLQHYGFDLIHFGIIVIMMAQVGFLTPPFGLCLFVTMREANASMQEVSKAVLPFILIMLIMTIAFIFLPDLVMFLPNLLMGAG